nr:unnamed protein product [Spirometra erinaceieuropaei]
MPNVLRSPTRSASTPATGFPVISSPLLTPDRALSGKSVFSKIDLVRAFHQIPVTTEDVTKTVINTLFEFPRPPPLSNGCSHSLTSVGRFTRLPGAFSLSDVVDPNALLASARQPITLLPTQ